MPFNNEFLLINFVKFLFIFTVMHIDNVFLLVNFVKIIFIFTKMFYYQ